MKIAALVASILLGLVFLLGSVPFLLNIVPDMPKPPEGSAQAMFMGAFAPTGYLHFVKVFELIGAILVIIPKTRNFGLLVLGPIILNILAFTVLIMKGEGLGNPLVILAVVTSLFLLWDARQKFAALLN